MVEEKVLTAPWLERGNIGNINKKVLTLKTSDYEKSNFMLLRSSLGRMFGRRAGYRRGDGISAFGRNFDEWDGEFHQQHFAYHW